MTLDDLRVRRAKLEADIRRAVYDFTVETSVGVRGLVVDCLPRRLMDGQSVYVAGKVHAELEL